MNLPAPGSVAARIAHIPMPPSIARLPLHPEMRMPLPWFCQQEPPDFRIIRPGAIEDAHRKGLCWITGEPRYPKRMAFVVGPMCVLSGTNPELPSRPDAAQYAARACPFLANPRMRRNKAGIPEDASAPGHSIERNPGCCAVLITDRYKPFSDGRGGVLFEMGPPLAVSWWAEGRPATAAEVRHSIDTGLPILRGMADQDPRRAEAHADLDRAIAAVERWLPQETAAA